MKLKIDLVPKTAWYSNLRAKIPKEEWDKIRKQSYADAKHKCAICSAKEKLNCHEIWEYDDIKHIQKLNGFIALCDNCHMIKHIGFAEIQASKKLLNMGKLIKHFMDINKVNKKFFEDHYTKSFEVWKKRSKHKWETNLSKWSFLISNKQIK